MAIRTRILLVVVALVLLALAALDVVAYKVVQRSLISTADTQLQSAQGKFLALLSGYSPAPNSDLACYGLPADSFGAFYSSSGKYLKGAACSSSATVVTSTIPPSLLAAVESSGSAQYATVSTSGPVKSIRVMATSLRGITSSPTILVVAEPMRPIDSTLSNLLLLELLVTGTIVFAVGVTAYFLVQLGLKPLEDMAGTAGEIAAGDLSRRVENTDERTEVGRLGSSLNTMLARIEQAFREKEASESRLRRFVADAGHELRTPLTSIRGYAELFRDGKAGREADLSVALGRIESESARMSVLVEDLLLLARLDQGRPLEHAPVDLGTLADDAVRDARVIAPDREISLERSGQLVAVGDEQRLRQVLANLVGNAIAHTPAGSPVELIAQGLGEQVRLMVVDHGAGIPAEQRAKVFDRFWRADESRQRARGGSGLGLSIVAAVVAAHGGRVFLGETPGGGATFLVDLPAGGTGSADSSGGLGQPAFQPTDDPGSPSAGDGGDGAPADRGLSQAPAQPSVPDLTKS